MARLKVPSLQHLARNWRDDPIRVKRVLVQLAQNSPTFNYNPLFGAVRDMLVFAQPYDEIIEGMRRAIQRADVRENFLGVLPLIKDYFQGVTPTFVQSVERRYYPVGRSLMVPFDPPLIYGMDGGIHFPWFSFWRTNPIARLRLSLFVSMVDDVLSQDPDLEDAKFEILDFSAAEPNKSRELTVINAKDVPRVSNEEKAEMLSVFAEGFFLAQAELAEIKAQRPDNRPGNDRRDDDQPGLFD